MSIAALRLEERKPVAVNHVVCFTSNIGTASTRLLVFFLDADMIGRRILFNKIKRDLFCRNSLSSSKKFRWSGNGNEELQ